MRIDYLEALVGERRRVSSDLPAHVPRRMSECLVGCHVLPLVAGAAAERAAAGGEDEALGLAELSALEERGVFAVDGDQVAVAAQPRLEGELPGCDEALLVGERERDAVLERPHRRSEPREADDRVQDDVRMRAFEQLRRGAAGLRQRRESADPR